MKRTTVLIPIVLFLSAGFMHGQTPAPFQAELQQKLVGNYLTLRTPVAGAKLHYTADGMSQRDTAPGIRSVDGLLQVKSVELGSGAVVIKANRLVMTYNVKAGALQFGSTTLPVEITLDTSSEAGEAVSELLGKVFFSGAELASRACSPDEKIAFQQWALKQQASARRKNNKKTANTAKSNVPPLCVPTGERVYSILDGITPAKPTSLKEPEYGDAARRARAEGISVAAVVVDETGKVVDALLLYGDDARLNYSAVDALRNSRFKPATRNGQPIPSLVSVKIDFRLD